jgi:hypothetical protein
MDPQIADAIGPLIALFAFGTFSLIGLRMYLNYRARRLELADSAPSPHLSEAVDELRQEVQALRGEVGDLQERVDFAERLLTRGQEH